MTPEKSSAGVHVLLTGFGPFTGVTENPTQIVAEALDREPDKRIGAYSQYTVVDPAVEVSVGECERMSKAMADKAEALTGKALVLHMGVDAACDHFKLERTAYNLADFRVPDVKGAHLRGHKIIPEAPQELQTVVDVEAVVRSCPDESCRLVVSDDAGRYLCNFIYFNSLYNTANHALFLHLPSLDACPRDVQCGFVKSVLNAVAEECERSHF